MRPDIRHLIMQRMKSDYGNDMHSMRDMRDMESDMNDMARNRRDNRDMRDEADFADERRGVRGSGRRRQNRDRGEDFFDDEDFDKPLKLSRRAKAQWKRNLVNSDGTHGPHFKNDDLYHAIDKMRLHYDNYTEEDVCLMANVLYSDFYEAFGQLIPQDKEAYYWVAAAKMFLEDEDSGLDGAEKVAAYYYLIVNG